MLPALRNIASSTFLKLDAAKWLDAYESQYQQHQQYQQYHETCKSKFQKTNLRTKCCVSVIGLGGVGTSLAHLLKMFPCGITDIHLCNRSDPKGIVEELSHIPTAVNIRGFKGTENFPKGLGDTDIVVITAGVSRKKNETREELFKSNATICTQIVELCADTCPEALMCIVSNPVDSLVPLAARVLDKRGVYQPRKLFGICKIDQMRAQNFYAELIGFNPNDTYVPVVGGHSDTSMVPLFSQGRPQVTLPIEELINLIHMVRTAGKRVVQAKEGVKQGGGSTYSMASAALHFIHKLCRAIQYEPHVILSAYVESRVTNAKFFSNEVLLGPNGIEANLGYGPVTDFEQKLIDEAIITINHSIQLGEEFVTKK